MSQRTIIIIAASVGVMFLLCCGGMGLFAFLGAKQEKAAREEMLLADAIWDKGDKGGAAASYQKIVDDGKARWVKDADRPRLYGRLIDYRFEKGDAAAGKELIDKANKEGTTPSVNNERAKSALAAIQIEKKSKETTAAKKKSRYTRDEFKELVQSKSKTEVLDLLGKPSRTQELGEIAEYWYYGGITFDPVTDRTDSFVQIAFENGRVSSLIFT